MPEEQEQKNQSDALTESQAAEERYRKAEENLRRLAEADRTGGREAVQKLIEEIIQ